MGKQFLIFVVSITLLILCMHTQNISANSIQSLTQIKDNGELKEDGWYLPWLNIPLSTLSQKTLYLDIDNGRFDKVAIIDKTIDINTHNIDVSLIVKDDTKIGDIRVNIYNCEVRTLHSYEYKHKVFCYAISCVPFTIQDGHKSYTGAVYDLYYNDNNNDGIFETMYSSKISPVIPDWIKKEVEIELSTNELYIPVK